MTIEASYIEKVEVRNAVIQSTMLGVEDHGILTCMIHTSSGVVGQGFGGWAFDAWNERAKRREGTAWGMHFVGLLLSTLEVGSWEKLPGTPCRVRATHNKIVAIGHFIRDRWFEPEKDLAFLRPQASPEGTEGKGREE